ncbi:MAG: helix-turn-helix domain-containing protein [Holosporales bacterium]|jgi:excisionase family DNA binding protein|nr:helix-turn-helix domain-containing protein [Holosporales bacterium]
MLRGSKPREWAYFCEHPEKMLLTIAETCTALGVSRKTAYDLANSEGFPVVRIGKRKLVSKIGLEQWVEKRCKEEQKRIIKEGDKK